MEIAGWDINWAIWTQYHPSVPFSVMNMIWKRYFWQISNVTVNFVFRASLYLNLLTVHVLLKLDRTHSLIKLTRKIKLVNEIELLSKLLEVGKLQNLLGMKFKTGVNLLFLSALDNNILVYFLCHRCVLWN